MPQKYGHLANEAVKEPFVCLVCGESSGFNWSDYHGEGMCNTCGTPYQLLQYDKESQELLDAPPKLNVKESWFPVLKQYWEETHQYTGLGTIMIPRDYPECIKGHRLLDEWLEEHEDLMPDD